MSDKIEINKENGNEKLEKKLTAIGWSLFFIWIGITMLLKINPDIGLFGIGVITLGMQWVRKNFGLKTEGFWIAVGVLFFIGSLWGVLDIGISLVPLLIIVAGGIALYSALRGKSEQPDN